jgi:predicted nucleic acid-binding protein
VRLLIDTNIFLELLLNQLKSDEARNLLSSATGHEMFISDFALHSIGLLLVRQGKESVFRQFVLDMILNAGVQVLSLPAENMDLALDAVARFRLDFDDAYQYAIAEKYALTIVSFDGDFDRTARGRLLPADIPPS